MPQHKFVTAKAKVLKRLENGTYELGFRCPDCASGWVTMTYGPLPEALQEGALVDVKIGKITRGAVLQIDPYIEQPEADWMPAVMMLAREAGIVEEPIKEAEWTTAYINSLPNSSFAYVESCYGKSTDNKNARHLPYKDADGSVDLPHLRNALARVNQIQLVCGGDRNAAISSARSKLEAAAKREGVGKYTVQQAMDPTAVRLAEFTPPEAGDLPAEPKKILAAAYSTCRQKWVDAHPRDPDNQTNKSDCAQMAWGAVHNAGWRKDASGTWKKLSENDAGLDGQMAPEQPQRNIFWFMYKLTDNDTGRTVIGLSEKELAAGTVADASDFVRVAEEQQMADFTLIHHKWDTAEHYDLILNTVPQTHIVMEKNPLADTEIKGVQRKPYSDDFWQKGIQLEEIASGQPGNPSKTFKCTVQQIDKGKVAIYQNESVVANEWNARVEFFGTKLEGRWSLASTVPNVWNLMKETTKLTDAFPMALQLNGGIDNFKETPDGLVIEGKALSFGVWNGMYWSPDVIKNSPIKDFDNMIIDVEHDNSKVAGKVLEKKLDGADINVKALVKDYEIAQKIKSGEYKGFSIDAIVMGDPVRRLITSVKQYKRLTVCANPACKVCYLGNCNV